MLFSSAPRHVSELSYTWFIARRSVISASTVTSERSHSRRVEGSNGPKNNRKREAYEADTAASVTHLLSGTRGTRCFRNNVFTAS